MDVHILPVRHTRSRTSSGMLSDRVPQFVRHGLERLTRLGVLTALHDLRPGPLRNHPDGSGFVRELTQLATCPRRADASCADHRPSTARDTVGGAGGNPGTLDHNPHRVHPGAPASVFPAPPEGLTPRGKGTPRSLTAAVTTSQGLQGGVNSPLASPEVGGAECGAATAAAVLTGDHRPRVRMQRVPGTNIALERCELSREHDHGRRVFVPPHFHVAVHDRDPRVHERSSRLSQQGASREQVKLNDNVSHGVSLPTGRAQSALSVPWNIRSPAKSAPTTSPPRGAASRTGRVADGAGRQTRWHPARGGDAPGPAEPNFPSTDPPPRSRRSG